MSWVAYARVGVRCAGRGLLLSALALVMIPSSAFAASASIKFTLPQDADIDFFRIYVGVQTQSYNQSFDLRRPAVAGTMASAMQEQLAGLLNEPRQFFLAMTSVDLKGQESAFSNEVVIDLRGGDADGDGILDRNDNCPRTSNQNQVDRGSVASPSDTQGARRDGIGDACQCGDLDGTGTVTDRDAQVIDMLGVVGGVMSMAGGSQSSVPRTCNVAGSAACDAADAAAIRAAVRGGPALQQVCLAATQPPSTNQALAFQLSMSCPAVARGEIRDTQLVSFCDDLRKALIEIVVRSLAQQCPAVARGQVRDPVIVQFCQDLTRAILGR